VSIRATLRYSTSPNEHLSGAARLKQGGQEFAADRHPGSGHGLGGFVTVARIDGDHLTPENWDNGFRTQTGQNINVAANGIAKLLRMMIEEDD